MGEETVKGILFLEEKGEIVSICQRVPKFLPIVLLIK